MSDQEFSGQVAVITGAGSGIGEACARLLVERGARVVVADLDLGAAEKVAADLGDAGLAVAADVSDPDAAQAMVSVAVDAFGRIDIAVNNAGITGPQALVGEYPLDGWRKTIDVNLNGVFYCLRAEIQAMLKTGGGSIINMTSVLGSVGFTHSSAYVATKHALVGLTKAAALEYASRGIRINSVGPGFVETPLLASWPPSVLAILQQLHPSGRLGRPEEVAELVAFLASARSSNTTGSYLLSDGGYSAR